MKKNQGRKFTFFTFLFFILLGFFISVSVRFFMGL